MKNATKINFLFILSLIANPLFAQTNQEMPLFSAMSLSLWTGIPLCLIGFGLSMFAWRKEGKGNIAANKEKRADKLGCIGLVIGGLGIICLLPILFLLQSIVITIFAAFFLLGVGYLIYRIVK